MKATWKSIEDGDNKAYFMGLDSSLAETPVRKDGAGEVDQPILARPGEASSDE